MSPFLKPRSRGSRERIDGNSVAKSHGGYRRLLSCKEVHLTKSPSIIWMNHTSKLPAAGSTCQAIQALQNNDNPINFSFYGHLIQLCTVRGLFRQVQQLQARIILYSATADNFLASKLIAFYSKTNKLSCARGVFDLIPSKNVFAFNALLIAYCVHNHHAETLTQFFSLLSGKNVCPGLVQVEPDAFTMSCVLKAMSEVVADEPLLTRMIHCYVMKKGFFSDLFVGNGLMTYYSRSDDPLSAKGLFNEMPDKDLVSWNAMIAGYSQGGFYKECKDLYKVMLDSRELKPDAVTVISTLHACAQSNDLIFGMEVHRYVIDNRIEMDLSVCNAIMAVYAKCGSLDYAKELFEEMSEKDEISYSTIISGYMVHGQVEEAMMIFRKMRQPALSTWNAVISGQVQNNKYDEVIDLVRQMRYMLTLLKTRRVFDISKIRSVIVWTSIISAYATHGDANFALSLFDKMLMGKTKPDEVTFTAVLAACARGGLLDKALEIFDSLLPKYGVQPLVNHYACVVVCMSRAGRLSQALKFVEEMPIEPSAKVWGALLSGASEFGDVELGKFVFDHLMELEPDNPSNYIIMANLYSDSGRWEEAEKVRETLKKLGLKKVAGSSRV
ncbi:pentatricopeptide repeat-containing protein [Dorcoceras hygrometricum]|uniref:Pentatricopeptide repeat-containing protein n=1 Tax=Dorcoceras hygrometricum TaxID=472368 RepID=A0A2Z7AYV7_9LAMI|nr:pentatricopeptide repeat-containing protein [Dorcoceras hygrometricum]